MNRITKAVVMVIGGVLVGGSLLGAGAASADTGAAASGNSNDPDATPVSIGC
jgi:hypothetical protein